MSIDEKQKPEQEKTEPVEKPAMEKPEGGVLATAVDIDAIVNNPDVLNAILNHDRVKSTLKNAVNDATIVEPQKPRGRETDEDIALMKRAFHENLVSSLSAESLRRFAIETDGMTLTQKKRWIDENVKPETVTRPSATGLPVAAEKKQISIAKWAQENGLYK